MQANGQFTLMNPTEAEVLAFDFTTQLAAGDNVVIASEGFDPVNLTVK